MVIQTHQLVDRQAAERISISWILAMRMDLSYEPNIDLLGPATWMSSGCEQSPKPGLRSRKQVGVPRHSERSPEVTKMIQPMTTGDPNVPGRAEMYFKMGLMHSLTDK